MSIEESFFRKEVVEKLGPTPNRTLRDIHFPCRKKPMVQFLCIVNFSLGY